MPQSGTPKIKLPSIPSFAPLVLVDDDAELLSFACAVLADAGIGPVRTFTDSRELLPFLVETEAAVIVLDLMMPHLQGTDLLPKIREEYPQVPVIVITRMADVQTAVDCMKAGAFDYLLKPVERRRLVSSVRRALEMRELQREVQTLQEQLLSTRAEEVHSFHGIVTRNRKLQSIFRYMEAVARSWQPVLITGETGVGKELIARAIHDLGGCRGEFIAVNVAGLDDAMYSDTLFGHRKGAFTGAVQDREGLLARASGGTLFLDEIGDLEKRSQVKLLRLIEEKEYYPLGSDEPRKSDARILCATHRDLKALASGGEFRKDLYFRLFAHHVHIPPLRERLEDLPLLVDTYLEDAAQSLGKKKPTPPPELLQLLSAYDFPGNVRELRAMIYDAVTRHDSGVLSLDSFRKVLGESRSALSPMAATEDAHNGIAPFELPARLPTLKETEEHVIREALRRAGNNQGVAALMLGITREALNKRLARKKRLDDEKGPAGKAA